MTATLIGDYLQHAPGASRTVLLSDGSLYVTYEAIQFLAPHSGGCTLMPGQPMRSCPDWKASRLFILLPARTTDLKSLERNRPGGRVVTVGTFDYGRARILAYQLPS
jgi:hypothetical protein